MNGFAERLKAKCSHYTKEQLDAGMMNVCIEETIMECFASQVTWEKARARKDGK